LIADERQLQEHPMKKELREEFWRAFEKSPFIMIRLKSPAAMPSR
jgi:hypothetical protein